MDDGEDDGNKGFGSAPEPRRVKSTDDDGYAVFESELALAALLMCEQVFVNGRHWKAGCADDIAVCVNCNDVFAWGCADAEDLPWSELESLYDHFAKDPVWGSAVWCMKQRGMWPQAAVAKRIRDAGIWDLSSMKLRSNRYDAACRQMAAQRLEPESSWENEGGLCAASR